MAYCTRLGWLLALCLRIMVLAIKHRSPAQPKHIDRETETDKTQEYDSKHANIDSIGDFVLMHQSTI